MLNLSKKKKVIIVSFKNIFIILVHLKKKFDKNQKSKFSVKKINMERRLVPLTDEIKELSLLNVKTWDGKQLENDEAGTSQKVVNESESNEKIKDIISKLNKKSSGKFDIFVTKSTQNAKIIKDKMENSKVTKKHFYCI